MEKRSEVIHELLTILDKVKDHDCQIDDFDKNLFGSYYDYTSGEMLDFCMELKKEYHISLNNFIYKMKDYTVNNIADALIEVMITNE